jgi:hypothetical protein
LTSSFNSSTCLSFSDRSFSFSSIDFSNLSRSSFEMSFLAAAVSFTCV